MNAIRFSAAASALLSVSLTLAAQTAGDGQRTSPTPRATPPRTVVTETTPKPTPKSEERLSEQLLRKVDSLPADKSVSQEKREQALAKLLEGQRHLWLAKRSRAAQTTSGRAARLAFQQAVELDPTMAEGYTALAELAWNLPPNDLDESLRLAQIAVRIDRNNYGGQRILARAFTLKSRLNRGQFDRSFAEKAIATWNEVVRLDARNPEAHAFLAALYQATGQAKERIGALRNWLGAAQPVDAFFYRTLMGGGADLSPENAALPLAAALIDDGDTAEAVKILNQSVADNPDDPQALELLSKALDSADAKTASSAIQSIQQAIYANPANASLILLLAKVQARSGDSAETARFIAETVARIAKTDKNAAAGLQIGLGEVYFDAGKYDAAVAEFRSALKTRGIDTARLAEDEEREFAVIAYDKIIRAFKAADRFEEARSAILAAEKVLGDEDSFTDRQLIALYQETARRAEALKAVKYARVRFPDDYGFLRTEATLLTELGRVDEGVAIVRSLIGKQNPQRPSVMYDDFTNHLFISILYSEAKRGKDAVEAANKALEMTGQDERRQIALLTLATAQNISGDFKSAEATLRSILKTSPGNPIALNNLGYFLVERNERLDEALGMIRQAVETEPNNSSYLDSLGWAYFKLGKLEEAEENLRKAARLDPTSATIHDHLGDVYQKRGKTELARTAWQKALGLSTDPKQAEELRRKLGIRKSGRE